MGRVTAVDAVNERFTLWLQDERRVCSGPYDSDIHLEFLRKHLTPDRETGPTVAIIGKIDFDSRHNRRAGTGCIPSRRSTKTKATYA